MSQVVTLTPNPAVDMSTTVEAMVPDRKLRGTETLLEPGGGGINVARVVSELGGQALALFPQGGPTGTLLVELLARAERPHQAIPIAQNTRENVTVTEKRTGSQYRVVLEGPELSAEEADAMLEVVTGLAPAPEYLVMSGSLPRGVSSAFYKQLVEHAPARSRVVVDTSGPALAALRGSGAFMVKPNLREVSELAGRALESDAAIEEAALALIAAEFAQVVLVSMGDRGAFLVSAEQRARLLVPPVRPVSRVGAGDSTVGGFVCALSRGADLFDAARFAVAAGTAAVLTPGSELCKRADVERLVHEVELRPR